MAARGGQVSEYVRRRGSREVVNAMGGGHSGGLPPPCLAACGDGLRRAFAALLLYVLL